eukprot:GEMP01065937.1.p1 GENE.GEMP01065937.1~~GEMP01065937.1.p1  ORF type:complete len:324 (+),score=53.84 GEMP01065937.1:141-1112(+)
MTVFLNSRPSAGVFLAESGLATNGVQLDFNLWIPAESSECPEKQYPLVIYLHGQSERNNLRDGVRGLLQYSLAFRKTFIVLVPKSPKNHYWFHSGDEGYNNEYSRELVSAMRTLIAEVLRFCPVDNNRVTLCGVSMGGFGALTYLQHCADFITAVVLLGAHFDGTLDTKFIKKVYHYGIARETFHAIIAKCRRRPMRMWILHGEKDKTCSYKDILAFFLVAGENDYNWISLQIHGDNKPLKTHYGPYEWMFGEDRLRYPHPLGVFCAWPEEYNDPSHVDSPDSSGDLLETKLFCASLRFYRFLIQTKTSGKGRTAMGGARCVV